MSNKELLAVLDLSEDEQWTWCVLNHIKHAGESLADLAFRLRDEVCINNASCDKYTDALRCIYDKWLLIQTPQTSLVITFTVWLIVVKTAIDMVIAALIAKENHGQ